MDFEITLYNDASTSSGGSSSMLFILLLIIPIGLIVFFMIKKKKGSSQNKVQKKEERDEVWATIKKFLKQNNETGKEVIDVFTVKRPNPYDKSTMSKEQRLEYKIEQKKLNDLKTKDPEEYKKIKVKQQIERKRKPKELYVVLFTTRDTKTLVADDPRVLECEVVLKKINRSKTERTIQINGLMDYETEMKWIGPIKEKEDKQYQKQLQRQQKRQERRNNKKVKGVK